MQDVLQQQGQGLSLYFTPKKMIWSDFNNAGVLQKSSEIEERKVRQDVLCSGRADTQGLEVMPPLCVLLYRNKRQIKTRKEA